jgi:hypothetical protein
MRVAVKKNVALAFALFFLIDLLPTASANHNQDLVEKETRSNAYLIGQINAAIVAKDFYTAAVWLTELAQNFKAIDGTDPAKGSKTEWKRIHADIISAAFRGVGACGEQDLQKLKAEVAAIIALNKEKRSKFR